MLEALDHIIVSIVVYQPP